MAVPPTKLRNPSSAGLPTEKRTARPGGSAKTGLMEDRGLSGKEVSSPAWHGDVLAERDRLIESGEEKFVDWETAKRKLREELQ